MTIQGLVAELNAVDAAFASTTDNASFEALYERHWALRGAINVTPARSLAELHAKARALQVEIFRDEEFTNHGSGSARELAKSLVADLLAITSA